MVPISLFMGFLRATKGSPCTHDILFTNGRKKHSGSVIVLDVGFEEMLIRDSPVTVSCPWARNLICCLVMVQHMKTGNRPSVTKIVQWDVNHQHKQTKPKRC